MSIYSLSVFCAEKINEFKEKEKSGPFKILLCGDSMSICECLEFFESSLSDSSLTNVIVAIDDQVRTFHMTQFQNIKGLKIIHWNGLDDSLKRSLATEYNPIRIAVDFKPSLRRLHKMSEVLTKNSLVIIKEEGNCWRNIFPALFASFAEKNTILINFDEYMAEQSNENNFEDFYFDQKLRI